MPPARLSSLASALALLLLALLLGAAKAQAGDLVLERAHVGHLGAEPGKALLPHGAIEVTQTWLPCELILANRGGSSYRGRLVVLGLSYDSEQRRYERTLQLDPGARKRVVIPVLFTALEGWTWKVFFLDEEQGRVDLARATTGPEVLGVATSLRLPEARPLNEALVLVLRGRDALATQLSALQGELGIFSPGGDLTREWRLVELPNPSALPEQGQLLHRVDVLILDDLDLESLGEAREAAILGWVAEGGRLWVSTLQTTPSGGPLAQALPGEGSGVVVSDPTLSELEGILGEAPRLEAANSIRRFSLREGDEGWRPGGSSGVVHRRHGQGWIVRAGFRLTSAPFPRRALIRELVELRSNAAQRGLSGERPAQALLQNFARPLRLSTLKSVPGRGAVGVLVVLFLGLGVALPFAAFRRSGRLELAWGCVLLSTAIATGAVFLLGRASAQESRIVRLSLVEGGARGSALRTSGLSVFSKEGGALELEFTREVQAGVLPARRREEDTGDLISCTSGERSYRLETHPQEASLLALRDRVELPGEVRFVQTGPSSGRVERSSEPGWELRGAWAFDADGAPFESLETPSELATGPRHLDPVLNTVFQAALEDVALRAKAERTPLLLYWWSGPALQEGLPEHGLDLGIVRPGPGWGAWGPLPTAELSLASSAGDPAEGVVFYGRLPDPSRAVELQLVSTRSELWPVQFLERGDPPRWGPIQSGTNLEREESGPRKVEGAWLRRTPLGGWWGRVRVPSSGVLPTGNVTLRLGARRKAWDQ